MVFESPGHGVEGPSHGKLDVLVAVVLACEELLAGQAHVDLHHITVPLVMTVSGGFDHDVATRQIRREFLKFHGPPPDVVLQRRQRHQIAERDLQWQLHHTLQAPTLWSSWTDVRAWH